MEVFWQTFVEYIPKAFVFICSLGVLLTILFANVLFNWVADLVRLPWMQEKNKKFRKQYLENTNKK